MEQTELRRKVREAIAASFHYHDYYSELAKEMFGENFTKEHRDMVKTAAFQVLYGSGATVRRSAPVTDYGVSPLEPNLGLWMAFKRLFGAKEEEAE